MWKRTAFILTVFITLLISPTLVFGQGQPELASLEVALWPEYDRPDVLVIYQIGLPSTVTLPIELNLRIPAAAGAPFAVAAKQPDDSLIKVPYESQTEGEWTTLTFTATTPETQLEYYDPRLNIDSDQRQFSFTWPGDYAVGNLTVQVQQPFDATDMSISPDMGPGERQQDGLIYYTGVYGALNAGQTFDTSITYNKTSDTLTSTNRPVDPISPVDESAQGRSKLMSSLPWVLGGLGVLLLFGGGLWYWQSSRNKAEQVRRPRHKPAGQRQPPANTTSAPGQDNIYCHQCGKRAGPGDKFCRACGTQLRPG
jgi:hypothetical protein